MKHKRSAVDMIRDRFLPHLRKCIQMQILINRIATAAKLTTVCAIFVATFSAVSPIEI